MCEAPGPRIELTPVIEHGCIQSWRAIAYFRGGWVEVAPENTAQDALDEVMLQLAHMKLEGAVTYRG